MLFQRNFVSFLLTIFATFGFSQNQAKNWYFGVGAGVSFTGTANSPTLVPNGAITSTMGCSSISDAAGNLLFYTDGSTVYNQNHAVMANGTGLLGSNAFQSSIIIQQPQSNHLYYVFTVGALSSTNGLNYSVVDMNLAAGLGSVTVKNASIYPHSRDKLTAGKHCNGNDVWVLSTGGTSNVFVSCLLTATGISSVVPSPAQPTVAISRTGQLKLSPNGRRLMIRSCHLQSIGSCAVDYRGIFEFDNITGQVIYGNGTTFLHSSIGACPFQSYGFEFSPDSRFYYFPLTSTSSYHLLGVDICATTASETPVPDGNNNNGVGYFPGDVRSMQLAPDGKIYLALVGANRLSCINNPMQSGGLSATHNSVGVSLGTFSCQWGLPNFPGYYFEKKPTPIINHTVTNNTCLTTNFSTPFICQATGYTITGYQWNFGDPSSGANNQSFLQSPIHNYSAAGNYTVSLIRYFMCNTNDTITTVISLTQPSLSVQTSTQLCASTTASAIVSGGSGNYSYNWSGSTQTGTEATYTASGIYTVTISDLGAGGCSRTQTVSLSVVSLSASLNQNIIQCNGQNNGSATITVTGGVTTYSYHWGAASPQNTVAVAGLSPGFYTVMATDLGSQCSISKSFSVTEPPVLTHTATNPSTVLCVGQPVFLNVLASGGTPGYQYQWSNGVSGTTSLIVLPTQAGIQNYTCSITDAYSCNTSQVFTLTVNANPVIQSSNITACFGDIITFTAQGATNYTWMPAAVYNSSFTTLASAFSIYTVTGESNGCYGSKKVSVSVNPLPLISANSNAPLCQGQDLILTVNTASIYQWSGPQSFSSSIQSPTLSNSNSSLSGNYTVSIYDHLSCRASTTIQVVIHPQPTLTASASKTIICEGESVVLSASGAQNYLWSNLGANTPTVLAKPYTSMRYQLTGYSALGCSDTTSLFISYTRCTDLLATSSFLNKVKVFPNPNKGLLQVEAKGMQRIQLYNATGNLVQQVFFNSVEFCQIELNNFRNGIYLIEILCDEGVYQQKLILEK